MKVIATYTVLIAVLLLPLFIMAETIVVKDSVVLQTNKLSFYIFSSSVAQSAMDDRSYGA